jgi:hypothetical protein
VPKTQVGHQRHVLAEAVVVVAGHQAVAGVLDAAGLGAEVVPDAGQLAALGGAAFDLEGRGGAAPFERRGKTQDFQS